MIRDDETGRDKKDGGILKREVEMWLLQAGILNPCPCKAAEGAESKLGKSGGALYVLNGPESSDAGEWNGSGERKVIG